MQQPAAPEPVAETMLTDAPQVAADKSTVSRMYPTMPATPTVAPAAEAEPAAETMLTDAPQAEADKSLYPSMNEEKPFVDSNAPDAVKALRDADKDRRMFSPQRAYASDLPASIFDRVEGITAEVREQAAGVWREVAADLQIPPVEVRELVGIFQAPPPPPEVQEANRSASMKWLIDQHGDRAGHVLEAAQALVARDPRVAALLDHSGAGDNPKVVAKIVASALRQVASGKLKMPKKK
jgi:hypothetical protein